VTRQKRHLTRDNAQPGAPPALRRGLRILRRLRRRAKAAPRAGRWRRKALSDFGVGAAQVEVHNPPVGIVENKDLRCVICRRGTLDGQRNVQAGSGAKEIMAPKGRQRIGKSVGYGGIPCL